MPVSIKDVAHRAGTSRGTVSKVLNNVEGFQISAEKRQRIAQVAKELGYQPNQTARALGRGKSDTIGLIIFNLSNPFFAEVADIVQRLALQAGYRVIIEVAQQKGEGYGVSGNLGGWPLDGILAWAGTQDMLADSQEANPRKCPVVYLGDERMVGNDWVSFDLYGGGRAITEHILKSGYKRPWMVTPYPYRTAMEMEPRHKAFEDVCQQYGAPFRIYQLPREEESRKIGIETGLEIASLPQDERPDAIFCHNDLIAVGVYHGLLRAGLRVPGDIAVVGFDGIDEGKHLDRPLTTISMPTEILCKTALDILLRRINGDVVSEPYGLKVPGRLTVGATT